MSYPEYANINGTRYKLNTDFRVGLKCLDVADDPGICDEERALAIIYILFGFIPENEPLQPFLDKAQIFLQCGQTHEEQTAKKKDMDFNHDRGYINASFMSDYHIDLNSVNMHFWMFCELIQGLTENSVLSRVREIRNYNLSDIKDAKTRSKIAKAQAELAIPVKHTREEIDALMEFEQLFGGDKA